MDKSISQKPEYRKFWPSIWGNRNGMIGYCTAEVPVSNSKTEIMTEQGRAYEVLSQLPSCGAYIRR